MNELFLFTALEIRPRLSRYKQVSISTMKEEESKFCLANLNPQHPLVESPSTNCTAKVSVGVVRTLTLIRRSHPSPSHNFIPSSPTVSLTAPYLLLTSHSDLTRRPISTDRLPDRCDRLRRRYLSPNPPLPPYPTATHPLPRP